jgi:hypothetical protein
MKKFEKTLCNFMASFFDDKFIYINDYILKNSDLPTDKESFIKLIRKDVQLAMWGLTELCYWGMEQKYLEDLVIYVSEKDGNYFKVLKIHNEYIKYFYDSQNRKYILESTKPKKKTIIYFE